MSFAISVIIHIIVAIILIKIGYRAGYNDGRETILKLIEVERLMMKRKKEHNEDVVIEIDGIRHGLVDLPKDVTFCYDVCSLANICRNSDVVSLCDKFGTNKCFNKV